MYACFTAERRFKFVNITVYCMHGLCIVNMQDGFIALLKFATQDCHHLMLCMIQRFCKLLYLCMKTKCYALKFKHQIYKLLASYICECLCTIQFTQFFSSASYIHHHHFPTAASPTSARQVRHRPASKGKQA